MSWRKRRNREKKLQRQGRGCSSTDLVVVPGVGVQPRSSTLEGYDYYHRGGTAGFQTYTPPPPHKQHIGQPVKVGKYVIHAGGVRDLKAVHMEGMDILIPLLQDVPSMAFGARYSVLAAPLVDYGGVPPNWHEFLAGDVVPLLEEGKKVLAFCMGSHGRTGCFLASLIAILESEEETPDPIAAARERHCEKSVESLEQAKAIFALRGQDLPAHYAVEFAVSKWSGWKGGGTVGGGGTTGGHYNSYDPNHNWGYY